jgi:hypothetical protein
MVEIVGIFVTAGNGEHPRAQDIDDTVCNEIRVARIGDQRRQPLRDTDAALGGGQQHHPAIGGDTAAIECGRDFLAFDGWEIERQEGIFGYGGCGSRDCVDWMASTPNL